MVTIFDAQGKPATLKMPVSDSHLLAFSATDANFFYLVCADGNNPLIQLVKTDLKGKLVKKRLLDTSQAEFNVFNQGNFPVSLVYGDGRLGMILSRSMQQSADGLNHQGSIAVLFDVQTLETVKNFGQNSGHSFNNRLLYDGQSFIALDLGDNYPRGVIMHQMTNEANPGRVIFTYKTHLGQGPSPYRAGLATGKWSNDNETYTELGDVLPTTDGFAVLLPSEKSWRNQDTGQSLNESRNLAFLVVAKDFAAAPQAANIVTRQIVVSKGEDTPEFGFYTFDGTYAKQRRVGVIWLTDYQDLASANATHAHLVRLNDETLLAIWEQWSNKAYQTTQALLLSPAGKKLSPITDLGPELRLPRENGPVLIDDKLVWAMPGQDSVRLNVIQLSALPAGN
jgi:hypothetical protein